MYLSADSRTLTEQELCYKLKGKTIKGSPEKFWQNSEVLLCHMSATDLVQALSSDSWSVLLKAYLRLKSILVEDLSPPSVYTYLTYLPWM